MGIGQNCPWPKRSFSRRLASAEGRPVRCVLATLFAVVPYVFGGAEAPGDSPTRLMRSECISSSVTSAVARGTRSQQSGGGEAHEAVSGDDHVVVQRQVQHA